MTCTRHAFVPGRMRTKRRWPRWDWDAQVVSRSTRNSVAVPAGRMFTSEADAEVHLLSWPRHGGDLALAPVNQELPESRFGRSRGGYAYLPHWRLATSQRRDTRI